jgi:hypothetical protein
LSIPDYDSNEENNEDDNDDDDIQQAGRQGAMGSLNRSDNYKQRKYDG